MIEARVVNATRESILFDESLCLDRVVYRIGMKAGVIVDPGVVGGVLSGSDIMFYT
jgi:predicted ribosome-associated RNA-binding protein Tma20